MRCANSTAATGALARPAGDGGGGEIKRRLVSALTLAPVALAAVHFGSPWFELLTTLAAALMAWEWDRLCGRSFGASGWIVMSAMLVLGAACLAGRFDLAMAIPLLAAAAAYAACRLAARPHPLWIAAGPLVLGFPCAAFMWLRADPLDGPAVAFWLLGVLWTTDVAAFLVGRAVGGARLAPRISPGKTWAGLGGAVAGASLWSLVWVSWTGSGSWLLAPLAAAVSVVAQGGDLGVSLVKRRFGAKDASNLIPGHGGVLDRVDGMLTAAPALAAFEIATNGGIVSWQ